MSNWVAAVVQLNIQKEHAALEGEIIKIAAKLQQAIVSKDSRTREDIVILSYLEVMKCLAKANIYYSDADESELFEVWSTYVGQMKPHLE